MPERDNAHLEVLTDAEKEAFETPGLRQRSRAIVAATELATVIGLSDDAHTALVERLRGLDKAGAKRASEAFSTVNELFSGLEIDLRTGSEGAIELRAGALAKEATQTDLSAEGDADKATSEQTTSDKPARSKSTKERRVASEASTATKLSIVEALDNLIEHEGRDSDYNHERVEVFLSQLERGGVSLPHITAEDFNHGTLKQLALIYVEASVRSDPDAIKTNIACTWGYLSGVEMADLVIWRSATKLGATAADVHNSRASFVNSVIKGWQRGMRIELPEEVLVVDDEEQEVELLTGPAGPLRSVPPLEEGADDEPAVQERSIDEEPRHIQIVSAFVDQLGLEINRRAFEELLNPQARGEFTAAKQIVLEQLRARVGVVSPDGSIINELDLSARGKHSLRRFLGMGFVKHGRTEERSPEPLKEQLRRVADQSGYASDLYQALEALLGVLTTENSLPEAELLVREPEVTPQSPLQVVFTNDGRAQLA